MITSVQLIALCLDCGYTGCEHILQEVSLPNSEAKGAPWKKDEVAFLRETTDEALADVAFALGRTYYATAKARSLVKRGILKA